MIMFFETIILAICHKEVYLVYYECFLIIMNEYIIFVKSFKKFGENYQSLDLSCQGSARSTDLHVLDCKIRHTFHSGVREKGLFHHPLKFTCIS